MGFIEPKATTLAKIKVVGIGGGGQNAVDSMVKDGKVEGVEFLAMNTDLQVLNKFTGQVRIQLGPDRTHGLGSGSDPDVGKEAANESIETITGTLEGADMVFLAVGEGGGTGSGAAPVVAEVAKSTGALTVGVVTKPFNFEGKRRMNQADQGIKELKSKVDALIVIPNEKLLEIVDDDVPLLDAFKIADQVVGKAVEGISDLITSAGLVNVDFADVKAIMKNAGSALMGVGQADGENRAERAALEAINSPLLEVDIKGSTGILINIVGDSSLTMHEVNKAARIVSDAAHEGANIIFGANIDPSISGVRVTVIATGFDTDYEGFESSVEVLDTDEIIEQFDNRIDTIEETEISYEEIVSVDDYSENFDLEALREEVKKEESKDTKKSKDSQDKMIDTKSKNEEGDNKKSEDPQGDKSNDDDSSPTGFWTFLKQGR